MSATPIPHVPATADGDGAVRALDPGPSDEALVARALEGDSWAEEALYRRHVRRVSDSATRVLGRSTEAEDVVQETFLKAFSKLDTLRDAALFERWLVRIAMNKVRGRLRKRKLLRSLGLDRTVDDATLERFATPTTPPDVRAELARIDAILRELAPTHRMAWMLHEVEGWSLPETASACDCSLATVKRWILKAKVRIDAHVAGERA
ncbi:MAG: RNA polymerase sigma factor [Sandaracinaceae bacterium]|nr:RNA polymerase sigma factor [Sandaracinaceae bacterium]